MRVCAAVLLAFIISDLPAEAKGKRRNTRARTADAQPAYDPAVINNPATVDPLAPKSQGPAVLRAQVLLDRAHFSVGEIDGAAGINLYRALSGFQAARKLSGAGQMDEATWQALNADTAPVVVPYKLTAEDVAGPFAPVPQDMMEKATLKALGYETLLEALGERFHASPGLLKRLNPSSNMAAGDEILVPNVESTLTAKAASVEVSKSALTVTARDAAGNIIAQYPSSVGSEHDPLPVGTWKINGVSRNPPFHYNPKLFWDANPSHSKAKIPPGPNNPVGIVWIDLSKEHYGIHGTPEPSKIGYTQSHGCIRLTNWDANELASLVSPGTPAILKE